MDDEKQKRREERREKRRKRWQTFKRTLPDAIELARPQAKLWALGLGLMMINRLAALVLPGAPKFLLDDALPNADHTVLYTLIGIVLAATIVQGLTSFALTQTISKAGQRLIAQLRIKIHNHVSRLPIRYYDNHKTGEVVSRVMNDVEGVRNLVGTGMVEFLGGLITACLAFVILFYLNWQMTVVILASLGVFAIVMIKSFSVLGPIFKRRQELTAEVSGRLTESVGGIRVVKSYNTEDAERSLFAAGVQSILENILKTINAISFVALTTSVLLGLLGAGILFVGGRQLLAGELTTGEFISYLLYLGFMVAPLSSIIMIGTQLSEVFAGLERMKEVLSETREDEEEEKKGNLGNINGHVRFERIGFAYEADKPVLHDIDFVAEPGTVTALVGPSGSGKSTMIGLIASFYRPVTGAIFVDGIDLSTVKLRDYRSKLGAVLQENFLFAGTIRENIRYSRPDATDEQMREAARVAHCNEFIDRFPLGFETIIGERGVKLSGGQRQRLAIARALLADPRILILDEATSALDSESEAAIQDGLLKLMEGRTTFVIAHRLSTIRHATQILVLEDGRVSERGTHKELLTRRGRYFDMYTRQHDLTDLLICPGEGEEKEHEGSEEDREAAARRRAEKLSRILSGE